MKRLAALCLALPLLLCLTLTPTTARAQQAIPLSAIVPPTDQDYDDVQTLQNARIVIGYPVGTYGGRIRMTRYGFGVALARLLPWLLPPANEAMPSEDLALLRQDLQTKLQTHPLALAALKRLVSEFRPELTGLGQDVPAIQATLVALRPNLPPMPVCPPFSDVPRDHWAFQAVENLRRVGIVTGDHGRYRAR